MKLTNSHIVITGGASGLGLALVEHLQAHNKISVIARPSRGLDTLRKRYQDIELYEADLADLASVELAADALVKRGVKIDILINNAAVQHTPKFIDDDFRYETIKREIDINFTSICALTYLLMPLLLKETPSNIVNINSGLALVPKTSSAVYCATKGALNIFSKSLAHQLEETNISVNQAFLPLVDTGMPQGRGGAKLPVDQVAQHIISGIANNQAEINIGKVKLLRVIQRMSPTLATKIMKAA